MVSLLDTLAKEMQCTRNGVRLRLNHTLDRQRIGQMYHCAKVRTLYKDKNGFKKTFFIGGFTRLPATELYAYGKLGRIYNVTVPQHVLSSPNSAKLPLSPLCYGKTV